MTKLLAALTIGALALLAAVGTAAAQAAFSGDVSLINTFESAQQADSGGTGGVEVAADEFFGLPAGASSEVATVGADVEFPGFMDLWDIEISADSIVFERVADTDDPRLVVSAPSSFDRYYFTFADGVSGNFNTNDVFVIADQGDNGELVVVIEGGYDYSKTGFTVTPFTDPGTLPATGSPRTLVLATTALVLVGAGLVLVTARHRPA